MADTPQPAVLATSPAQYQRLGLEKGRIAPWEDGMRTDGGAGTFEWWYFDANLADGSKLVITFYTKDFSDVSGPLAPIVSVEFDRADGAHVSEEFHLSSHADFSASKTGCDVRIGPNHFSGDLHTYTIHAETASIQADVTLTGQVPSWRPETGTFLFGADEKHYFAWLPSVPRGQADVRVTYDGTTTAYSGVGYHDHNWGNVSMMELINHWYWARAKIGDYTVIAANLTVEDKYSNTQLPIFMLAKGDQIIADDGRNVQFNVEDIYTNTATDKPVANTTTYEYRDVAQHYLVTFKRQRDLFVHKFIDDVTGWKHALAWVMGVNGAYLRFTGDATIERYEGETLAETEQSQAIWELMYFGDVHDMGR